MIHERRNWSGKEASESCKSMFATPRRRAKANHIDASAASRAKPKGVR
jgi:hypothetical protein